MCANGCKQSEETVVMYEKLILVLETEGGSRPWELPAAIKGIIAS